MAGRRPKPPTPRYSPCPLSSSVPQNWVPYVQTYIVPEVQTVQTHYVKHHVYQHVHHYPHAHSFENRNTPAHVHERWMPAYAKAYRPGAEHPYR
ncbi:CotD family spore coat protein [Salicibibacter kimchii]|uniref:Spore coat protein CotH n=1 Tax=Salicibibacter kimchii TaxID=2099786 RepID=A0A345C2V1_9BACI|nr:CotD family spore coat protein [Salicibibacter kimchii]AXF57532.1 hypothetical protein DT065_17090 [Salicibibacter kimchii]